MRDDILIIGAGAAGLMAAHTLANAGKQVTVLEARNRTGGRIHTLSGASFFSHTELGAEFIHGDLPVTLGLLQEAGITYRPAGGEMYQHRNGRFSGSSMMTNNWGPLLKRLNELETDTNINAFMQREFAGDEYADLRAAVERYVAGYDTADPQKASAFALRNEWQHEDEDAQHRVNGGYCTMISYLAGKVKAKGGHIYLNAVARDIRWRGGSVKVTTADGAIYEASKLLIALPLGVLQAPFGATGAISFDPPVADYTHALQQMGFGAIIKVLFEFNTAFWLDNSTAQLAGKSLKDMSFLLSDEDIPTWWTQAPDSSRLLTGWLGGPGAAAKQHATDEELLALGLQSLAGIFKRDIQELKIKLVAYRIMNWTADPFARGSYAYDTVEAPGARKLLTAPIEDTIFFTGEYLYEGTAMGTVEAALTSALDAARKMMG